MKIVLSPHAQEIERQEREADHARLMAIVAQRRAKAEANRRASIAPWLERPVPSFAYSSNRASASAMPNPPHRPASKLTCNGRSLTIREWSERSGISTSAIRQRLAQGWGIERALSTPAHRTGRPSSAQQAEQAGQAGQAPTDRQTEQEPTDPQTEQAPGVVENFSQVLGTGAGSTAQEIPDIDFHKDNEDADCID